MKLKPLFLSLLALTLILAACGDAARGTEPAASEQPINTNTPQPDTPVSSDDETAVDEPLVEIIVGDVITGAAWKLAPTPSMSMAKRLPSRWI